MGSITESVGSHRSNVRRYSSFQTRLQRWNYGSSNGELPPQKVGNHVTSFVLQSPNEVHSDIGIATNHNIHPGCRTPALDLAQQAQLAACNYLGYSPRDLPNDIFRPQGSVSDRPVEVHMHHYHHHYVAPTSPFSHTNSQCCEGAAGEIPGPATTKLAITANSPVQALPNTNSTTICPAVALRGPSVLPQLIHTLHDRVQNPSQSLQNGTYVGDVEAAQRYMQNILWLKDQIDHGPDREVNQWQKKRGENLVGSKTRISGREPRSPDSGYMRPITSEQRAIRRARKLLWRRDGDDSHDSTSSEDVCRRKIKSRPTRDRAMLLQKCEKTRAFRNNSSPSNSLSEDNSMTDDSARTVSLLSVKCQSSPGVRLTIRKTRMIENGDSASTIEPSNQQICKSQRVVRPQGCLVCPSWPSTRRRDLKPCRARTPSEDSVRSSVQVSVHKSTPTNSSSSTESDPQQKERSPRAKPHKKGCGARASRQQASRDARAWDKIDRKPRNNSCRLNTRLEASVQPECVYEMDSESRIEEQDVEERHSNMPNEKSCLQDICMEEKESEDTNKSREQRSESQTGLQARIETSRKAILAEPAEKAWTPSLGSNRGQQHISLEHDRIGTYDPRCESLQEDPHNCFSPRIAENETEDYSSHNRLREAVEAAWNTNLGTKRGLGDYCVNFSSGHKCTDQAFPSETLHGDSKANTPLPFSAEGKAHSCLWKVRLGMKKGVEEDCRNKAPTDSIFQNIHKDQENLRALVAREECLQRELEDQTVARVAAEEKARVTAEEKAHIYEASAKAAEEGLRVLLDERALFHCKFKEELEKGATDRLRLQELLHLEKLKLESTESELREVRRSFQDSLPVGTRALPSKNTLQDHRLDGLSMHAEAPHGLGTGHDEAHLQLMTESEKRIAAEAKASRFEASAKAAEERLRSLLDERNWFYSRFKEELEQNNTDMKKLQQLMELEKSNNGLADLQQKKKVDVRPPMGLGLARKNLDTKTEDGQRVPRSGVSFRTSFRSRPDQELALDDRDRSRLGTLQEFEEPPDEQSQFSGTCDPEISNYKQEEDCFGEDWKSTSSISINEERDAPCMRVTSNETTSMKNEKKRPLSPINILRVRHWKSADGPLSVKVERRNGRDGENRTVLDVSPLGSRLDSIDLQFRENPESPDDCGWTADDSLDCKENAFDFRKSAGLALESCAQRSHVNGGQPMKFPSQWKKDTKAKLRRMIQQQEKTWKMAEDAVEELGRRLELLERYKMEVQDTLGRTRAIGNIDGFFKRLEENLGDCPRGFNSLYKSPIYEEGKSFYTFPIFVETKGGPRTCQDVCTSPSRPDFSKEFEIEKLKNEVAHLRVELQQRDSKRPDSPKLKLSPGSPLSLRLPTSRPVVADMDWSVHSLSGFETPLEGISPLHLISDRNPTTPEVIPDEMEPELANSFEEMKNITTHARQNASKQNSNGEVDRFERNGIRPYGTSELDVDDRGWVPIPDESRDKSAAPTFMENGTGQMERMDYQERNAGQEDIPLSVDLNSDEGQLRVLKTAVHKLSRIFWEQEEKLENFKRRYEKEDANNSQAKEDVKNLYLDMLKEMSQQLGELCRDLHAKTQSDEVLLKHERTIHNCYPLQRLVQKFQNTDSVDKAAATTKDVEQAQQLETKYDNTSLFSTKRLKYGTKPSIKGEEDRPEHIMADSENLTTALQAAEKKIEEQISSKLTNRLKYGAKQSIQGEGDQPEVIMADTEYLTTALQAAEMKIEEQISSNLLLTKELESGSQYLSKMKAEHAQELARTDHIINYTQKLNLDLSNDMSQTETSLTEITSRYKSLVWTLEQQLEDVKNEALSLQDAVNILNEEIVRKEKLVSDLEAEAKENKLQIEQLRSQIETNKNDTIENGREKLELLNSMQAMRKEMDEQQRHITELISVNEDLIAFSERKEDEIAGLKVTIERLQRCVDEKSAEAEKLSAETLAFSQEVVERRKEGETYRLRCTALKSKLEEIEHELQEREASMERLTQHLGKTIEGQDFILEEKEQLLLSLNRAQYKEHRLDDQVRQSKIIIQDLEDKLSSMDAEINEARLEMAEMQAKGQEALLIEQQAEEMRNRVHELEEEIMEKEGQISILKTSYPGEYTSTF